MRSCVHTGRFKMEPEIIIGYGCRKRSTTCKAIEYDIPTHKTTSPQERSSSPSGRDVNYDEKQLTRKIIFEFFLLSVQVS